MVWRIQPAHKRLQTRIEEMREFRRQHEQLCAVITRVLRPSVNQRASPEANKQSPVEQPLFDLTENNPVEVFICYLYRSNLQPNSCIPVCFFLFFFLYKTRN